MRERVGVVRLGVAASTRPAHSTSTSAASGGGGSAYSRKYVGKG